jgi:hypothetical protein
MDKKYQQAAKRNVGMALSNGTVTVELPIECCYEYGALVTGDLDSNGYRSPEVASDLSRGLFFMRNSSLRVALVFTLKRLIKTANINTKNFTVSKRCYRRRKSLA